MRYITLYNQHMVNLAQRRPNKTHQAEKSGQWGCGLSATETGSMFLHIIGELICNRSTCGRDAENANPWGRWYQLNVRMYNPDWNLFLLPQYQHVQYQLLFLRECCWQRRLFGSQHITPVFIGQFAARVWWNPFNPVLLGQDRGSHWSHVHRKKNNLSLLGVTPRFFISRVNLKSKGSKGLRDTAGDSSRTGCLGLRCKHGSAKNNVEYVGKLMGFNEISWEWTVNSGDLANKNCDLMWV